MTFSIIIGIKNPSAECGRKTFRLKTGSEMRVVALVLFTLKISACVPPVRQAGNDERLEDK